MIDTVTGGMFKRTPQLQPGSGSAAIMTATSAQARAAGQPAVGMGLARHPRRAGNDLSVALWAGATTGDSENARSAVRETRRHSCGRLQETRGSLGWLTHPWPLQARRTGRASRRPRQSTPRAAERDQHLCGSWCTANSSRTPGSSDRDRQRHDTVAPAA